MEYLQRLLGTLQQAVDFVSSFTAYLFGDEAHPGAGESENARETKNRRSQYNCEVETAHGDIPPGRYLEVFEEPLTAEVSSPNRETRERVEALNVNSVQTTEVVPELSEPPHKYDKESEQKLSDTCQFLTDACQDKFTAAVIGGNQKKDLEEFLEWEPKRTSWKGAAEQEVPEKVIETKWEPVSPQVGSKEHGELNSTGGTTVGQDKELQKTLWAKETQEGVPNEPQFLGEQQRGLERAPCTEGFQHGMLEETNKMANEQQLEAKKQEEAEAEQGQPKRVAEEEGILEAMLSGVENERNQEEVLEEQEEVRRSYQWEPKGEVEETAGIIVGWGKELKETLGNKEVQEGAPDQTWLVMEQQKELEDAIVWTGGFQHGVLEEVNKMAEGQQIETAKEDADDGQKWESNSMAVEEGIQEAVVGGPEAERNQEEVLEEEEEIGTSHQWQPKGELEEEREINMRQERELEKTLWNKVVPDWEQFVEEQQVRLERTKSSVEFQHGELEEADKMAERQCLEGEKEYEEVDVVEEKENMADMVGGKEGIQEEISSGEEREGDKEKVLEEIERNHQWEAKEEVEEVGGTTMALERELEGIWENKEVQQGTPVWEQFVEEQQVRLERTKSSEAFQHGQLEEADKMAERQCLEGEKEHEEIEVAEEKQDVADMVGGKEGVQEEIPSGEEIGDKEKVLEEVERSHQWEAKEEVEEVGGTTMALERELEGIWENKEVQQGTPVWEQFVEEQQVRLERTKSSEAFQHGQLEEADKMAERQCLEGEKEHEEIEVAEEKEDVADMVGGKEGVQEEIPSGEEIGDKEKVLEEVERSHQWEAKEKVEGVEGTTVALARELEGIWENKEVQQEALDWDQFVTKQQREVVEWSEGLQHGVVEEVDKMVEGQQLGTAREEEEEVKAEEDQQWETNRVAMEEGIMECILDKSENVGYQEEMLEEKEEVGRNHQWEPKGEEEEEERGTHEKQERELKETLWNKEVQQGSYWEQVVEKQQIGLERTASPVAFQCGQLEEAAIMVERQCLEVKKELAEEVEVVEEWERKVDIEAGKEGIQETMPSEEETEGDQQEDVEGEEEVERSHQWQPKQEVEEVGGTIDQEGELEETWTNKEVQQGAPECTQLVTEQQELEKMAAWTGGLQCGLLEVVDKMAEGQHLEVEQEEGEEVKADEHQQWNPDTVAVKGIQEGMLDEAETEGDYEEVPKGEKDMKTDLWEAEETAVNFQEQYGEPKGIPDNRMHQQGKLAGVEGNEADQQKEPVKNVAQAKVEEQEENTGRVLENDEGEEPEKLAEAWCLDKEVPAKITRDHLRELEEKQKSLQQGSMVSSISLESGLLPGPRTFPAEVTPLDTSAQKERVLLRRKSSIRRAPSLKRPRPSGENLAQETGMTDPKNAPPQPQPPQPQPQPQPPSRPTLRHSGFGPMHPNMMAELQMRLRKPQ